MSSAALGRCRTCLQSGLVQRVISTSRCAYSTDRCVSPLHCVRSPISTPRPHPSSAARSCSTLSKFPLGGSLLSPVHRVVDRSTCSDVAIVDPAHGPITYQRLSEHAQALGRSLDRLDACDQHGSAPSGEAVPPTVAALCSNGYGYVAAQWACWSRGYVFVPLCSQHPAKMMEYFLTDSSACALLFDSSHGSIASELSTTMKIPSLNIESAFAENEEDADTDNDSLSRSYNVDNWPSHPATLFYTSGTTGPPKGVPITHGNLCASIHSIIKAWEIVRHDTVLHCLPLHHVHGVINALNTPIAAGATVNMLPKFDAEKVWMELLGVPLRSVSSRDAPYSERTPTVFMAVPTMYAKLIAYADECRLSEAERADVVARCKRQRVMISGSAPLPDPILQAWESLTGHRLLERYGMTEIGMGLTNPLHGDRVPGAVGFPFPGVQARIVDGNGDVLVEGTDTFTQAKKGYNVEQGELHIKGPSVFHGYWQKPEATKKSFTEDGWFLTGDTAVFEKGVFRIVGRTSVDIIKFGGYKISALDVERCLLAHPRIADCAVVGLPDSVYGEVVTAVVVFKPSTLSSSESEPEPTLEELAAFVKESLPPYLTPRQLHTMTELPRNVMGKVNKKELAKSITPASS